MSVKVIYNLFRGEWKCKFRKQIRERGKAIWNNFYYQRKNLHNITYNLFNFSIN